MKTHRPPPKQSFALGRHSQTLSLGTRVKYTAGAAPVIRRFVWAGLSIVEERDANNAPVKRYYPQGFQTLNTQFSTLNSTFYTRDHLGSIRQHISATGTVLASYNYDPYGNLEVTSGPPPDFAYTGHLYHARSGLYFAPYRPYSAELGRWMSRDPIGEEGGLNLYGYVNGDPVGYLDPDGMDPQAVPGTNFDRHVRNPDKMARPGDAIRHPGKDYDNNCAAGSQHETGTKNNDAPYTPDWVQGNPVSESTPPGTMIAKGWKNGKYPNQPGSKSDNHTATLNSCPTNGEMSVREQYRDGDKGQGVAMKNRNSKRDGWYEVWTPHGTTGPPSKGYSGPPVAPQ